MSHQQRQDEDEKKSGSSGKAFAVGLAATALGVGIGTALYYFFNKDEENPSTSAGWEAQQAFLINHSDYNKDEDTDSYTTVSAYTTSDTSMYDEASNSNITISDDDFAFTNLDSASQPDYSSSSSHNSIQSGNHSGSGSHSSVSSISHQSHYSDDDSEELTDSTMPVIEVFSSESDSEWDLTDLSDVPMYNTRMPSPFRCLFDSFSPRWYRKYIQEEAEREKEMRQNKFRARSNTLEECSICFEVMLKADEQLLGLPCTHNFHLKCITPWLEQHQTCPVCRANADS